MKRSQPVSSESLHPRTVVAGEFLHTLSFPFLELLLRVSLKLGLCSVRKSPLAGCGFLHGPRKRGRVYI